MYSGGLTLNLAGSVYKNNMAINLTIYLIIHLSKTQGTMYRIVHFEIPSEDPERCMIFYREVFGWEYNRWGEEPYWLVKTGEDDEPGINGAITRRKDPGQTIINTIEVNDLDQTIEAIEAQGGEIVVPRITVPTIGFVIYFKDPDGNVSAALQPDGNAS